MIAGNLETPVAEGVATEEEPAPPAYLLPVTTQLVNTQQHPITLASNDDPASQGPAMREPQQQQLVTPLHSLTEEPAWIDCPFCKQMTKTRSARQGDSQQVFVTPLILSPLFPPPPS
ncbi:hypothetical protein F5Y19DRAFT_480978 [Xylariaceae sp. FL1651]|nr:hypothetical protein F5Y19DRAFT_480978 [Xylariaceae sp. FL1651]